MNRTHFILKKDITEIVLILEVDITQYARFSDDVIMYDNKTIANIKNGIITCKNPDKYISYNNKNIFSKPKIIVNTKNGEWNFNLKIVAETNQGTINALINQYLNLDSEFLNTFKLIDSVNQLS